MKNKILELIDFKKIDNLLDGFKKTTGLATAILNLEGNVLSHSEWRKLCVAFYQKHPETLNWCSEIKIELAEKLAEGENFHFYKCSNGLIEVAIPILIEGEHFANLFSGLFFFEEPDLTIFNLERQQYGFDEKTYNEALSLVPVIPLDKIKATMEFLLGTIEFIIEMAFQKAKQMDLNDSLTMSKLLVESIIDNSPALIYVADTDGKIKLANKEFQKIFALPKSQIVGKYRHEIMPAEIAEQHRNNDIDVIQSKKPIVSEEENLEADGKHFYISQKFPLFDLNGNIHAVGGVSTDITEKKKTQEALQESENKYRSLFENSADGILVLNEQSEILELNNSICEMLGYSREELVSINVIKLIHIDDLMSKDHAATLKQLKQGKTLASQYRLQKKDGSFIATELSTKMLREDRFLNTIRDITKRVLIEKKLRESDVKYRSFFENSMDAILLTSPDGKIHSANPTACILFGYSEKEIIKLGRNGLINPLDPRIPNLLSTRAEKGKVEGEITMIRKDKTTFEAEFTSAIFLNADNKLNTSMIIRDITDRKLFEKSLQESEKILSVIFNNHTDLQLLVRIDTEGEFRIKAINNPYIMTADAFGVKINLEEIIEKPISVLFQVLGLDKEIYEATILKYRKAATTEKPITYIESIDVLGKNYTSEITLNPVMNENGKCQYVLYNSRNITEQTRASGALLESEDKFSSAFNSSPVALGITNLEGRYIDINAAFCNLLGYSRDEIINNTSQDLDLFSPAIRDEMIANSNKNNGVLRNMEVQLTAKDGSTRYAVYSVEIILIGKAKHILMTAMDITDQKLAEVEAQENKVKLQTALDSMTDGVVISDTNGNFVEFNEAFATFHKFKNKEDCAKTFAEYPDILESVSPNGELIPVEMWAIPRALRGETLTNSEVHLRRKDTGETWVGSYSFSPIRDKDNVIIGSVVVGRDISELKEAELAFRETYSNLRSMIDNREDSIWSIDKDFNYIIFNKTYENIINKEHNIELKRGMSSTENLTEEQANFWIPTFKNVFEGESIVFEFSHVLSGETRHFRTSLNPIIEDNIITGASGLSIDITDLKLAEEALKLSEEKFEKSFRLSPYMVSISTMEGEVIETNERVFDTLGYTRAEFLGSNTTSIPLWVNPSERENFVTLLKQNKTIDNIEVQFRKKSGEINDYLLSASIIELNERKLFLSIINDITERKQKEKALKESEERYRDLFENSYAVMLLIDPENGNIVDANPAASRFYGWSNTELVNMNLSQLNTLEVDEINKILKQASKNNQNHFFFDHVLADHSIRSIEVYSAPIFLDGKKLMYSIVHDVTDRKQAETNLVNEKNLLSTIIENIPVMLARYDPSTSVLYLNKEFEDKLGWKTEELETINLMEKVYPDPIYREKAMTHMQKCNSEWEEFILHSKSGAVYDSEWCNILLNDGTQIGIGIDITEEKKSKAVIIKLNSELETKVKLRTEQLEASNKELETFTYSVSHDLKAPLRGIDGYSKLLSDIYKPNLDQEAQSFIEKIRSSTLQMNQIIDDLLDYSRMERSQSSIERIKIRDLITSVLSIYHTDIETYKFKITLEIADFIIVADPKGFIIAFRNLIENAIKFTKEKTNPTIKIEIEENESSWIISVNDNGIGFDMQYHHKIFDIFQRLQRAEDFPGTGIGLAMVSKAMQRMNGKAWAESIPNIGSTFYLEIPKNQ